MRLLPKCSECQCDEAQPCAGKRCCQAVTHRAWSATHGPVPVLPQAGGQGTKSWLRQKWHGHGGMLQLMEAHIGSAATPLLFDVFMAFVPLEVLPRARASSGVAWGPLACPSFVVILLSGSTCSHHNSASTAMDQSTAPAVILCSIRSALLHCVGEICAPSTNRHNYFQ